MKLSFQLRKKPNIAVLTDLGISIDMLYLISNIEHIFKKKILSNVLFY